MRKFILENILRVRWVVFYCPDGDNPELGLSVMGKIVGLYKGRVYFPSNVEYTRPPEKREFGESLHPL